MWLDHALRVQIIWLISTTWLLFRIYLVAYHKKSCEKVFAGSGKLQQRSDPLRPALVIWFVGFIFHVYLSLVATKSQSTFAGSKLRGTSNGRHHSKILLHLTRVTGTLVIVAMWSLGSSFLCHQYLATLRIRQDVDGAVLAYDVVWK